MSVLKGIEGMAIAAFLQEHSSYAVLTHINPDGDALGSSFALTSLLRSQDKEAVTVLLDAVPFKYAFPEFAPLQTLIGDVSCARFDAAIAVDCADIKRLGSGRSLFVELPNLSIDHHGSNDRFADLNHVDVSPATAQIIYDLFQDYGQQPDNTAQMALYMGIAADTGNLTYPSTTPRSFEICAQLARMGLDTSRVAEQIFNCRTLAATKLIGAFIPTIELHYGGRLAVALLSLQQISDCGASVSDTEVLINYARDIDTVEMACFLREMSKNTYKLSLRSKTDRIDVAAFAGRYGGGGHARASGCLMTGTPSDITAEILRSCAPLFD